MAIIPEVVTTVKESEHIKQMLKLKQQNYMNLSFKNYKSQFVSPGYVIITVDELR